MTLYVRILAFRLNVTGDAEVVPIKVETARSTWLFAEFLELYVGLKLDHL